MTDQCNHGCAYCYQPRGKQFLGFSVIAKAIDFFYPSFATGCFVNFYGGEPLLALNELKRTVEYVERLPKRTEQKIRYSVTTNGSLLNEEILGFLDEHDFLVTLSFDGLAQDISRKRGSFNFLVSVIPKLLARPRISLETNSVFSSETIGYLSESVQFIIRMGVRKLNVNFAHKPAWTSSSLLRLENEIARAREYFEAHYEHCQDVPWTNFCDQLECAVHYCPAGRSQMALSAQGTLWGCALFPHYFMNNNDAGACQEYCFGDVDSFIKNPESAYSQEIAKYSDLRMDHFSTPRQSCLMCGEIERCWICPVAAALTTREIGRIPAWRCQEQKLMRRERQILLDRFAKKDQRTPITSPR